MPSSLYTPLMIHTYIHIQTDKIATLKTRKGLASLAPTRSMQSMFGASERLLYLLEIVVPPIWVLGWRKRRGASKMNTSTGFACGLCNIFSWSVCGFYQCYPCWTQVHVIVTTYPSIIYDVQVLASKLLCDLRLRRSPSDYNSTHLCLVYQCYPSACNLSLFWWNTSFS